MITSTAKLEFVAGFVSQREVVLPKDGKFTIGRDRRRSLPIMSRKVSREHAVIECDNGNYVVTDCGSKRGTKVNDRAVEQRTLRSGDTIEIGDVKCRFVIESTRERSALQSADTPPIIGRGVVSERDATDPVMIAPKPTSRPKTDVPPTKVEIRKPDFSEEELARVGTTITDIRIIAALDKGRHTVIYKGIQDSKNRVVALKLLTQEACKKSETVQWFISSARKAGNFRHEDMVSLLGGGYVGKDLYVFTRFMDGGCARDRFARILEEGLTAIKRALESIVHVSRALEFAQGKGILHLGVRPAKILFDEKRRAKLNGLGFDHGPGAPDNGSALEYSAYSAPEQISGGEVAYVTDIYSLGASFYYMLTGCRPVRDARQRIPSPKLIHEKVPDSICRIIEKMVAPAPDQRYKSYGQLLHDVRWALRGETWPRG